MSTYAVGDIQGCFDELMQLLDTLAFNPSTDELWFVGDLVNRGPKSLETLRFVKGLGNSAKVVLGNHDLHLLAVSLGNLKHYAPGSLDDVLTAPDKDELLYWLRHLPLIHDDLDLGWTMIHAGLPPQWTLDQAKTYADEVSSAMQGSDATHFFADLYGNKPNLWDNQLTGMDRLRFITNCFTRLRYCTPKGKLKLKEKFAPNETEDATPWFNAPNRQTEQNSIIFGHWSTLGYHAKNNTLCLDTGCLWGGELTLIELTRPIRKFSLSCQGYVDPFSSST